MLHLSHPAGHESEPDVGRVEGVIPRREGKTLTWCEIRGKLGERIEVWTSEDDRERIVLDMAESRRIADGGACLDAHLSPHAAIVIGEALAAAGRRAVAWSTPR
jgi:hypothetical protein